jgi:hypothetical protein
VHENENALLKVHIGPSLQVTESVPRNLAKVGVAGSSPVVRSKKGLSDQRQRGQAQGWDSLRGLIHQRKTNETCAGLPPRRRAMSPRIDRSRASESSASCEGVAGHVVLEHLPTRAEHCSCDPIPGSGRPWSTPSGPGKNRATGWCVGVDQMGSGSSV